MNRVLSSWAPPLVYMAVIFFVSSQPRPLPELTSRVSDKVLHSIEYGGLAVLFVRALAREGVRRRGAVAAGIVAASLYGASDEYHQAFVPNRESTVSDWIADTLGAAAGAAAYAAAVSRSR